MTADEIQKCMENHFQVEFMQVEDDSGKHKNHKQSFGKGGHFNLLIVSDDFKGLNLLSRHRKIYDALDMKSASVHALAISALTVKEWKEKNVHSD